MKNAKGDLVEISSIPEWERGVLEQRAIADSVSPKEALLAALATQPNAKEVEQNKALAAKATAIQNKMLSGKKLTGAEESFCGKTSKVLQQWPTVWNRKLGNWKTV